MSDSWISWNPRIELPSKPKPSSKTSSRQLVQRGREVLHLAGQVTEAEVDELDPLLLRVRDDLGRRTFLHVVTFFCRFTGCRACDRGGRGRHRTQD